MANRSPKNAAFSALWILLILQQHGTDAAHYLGKSLGRLGEFHHGVSGEVFAVDGRTLHIKDFTYDGQGPAAYFWAGTTKSVGNQGFRIRDENNSGDVLRRYRKEGVTLTLPEGKTLRDIKWFSVWCEEFEVNFGDVKIPRNFEFPRPQKLGGLKGVHGVSSDNIVIVDAQTLLIPNLSYDGEAPDAKFWTGPGPKPSPQGIRIPDENGKEVPLRRYDRKTVVLTLPGDLTVFDMGHFGIWCEAFTVDFGHIQIPQKLNIPPSLKMLGVSPQSKLNCEVLHDDLAFEVRWAIAGDSIVIQLVAKLEGGEYMSFGVSGEDNHSVMIGGDVVVAWIDKDTQKGYAQDYYLQDKSQCSGPTGSCPDDKLSANNNIRLLNAATVNGYNIVTYQRPLKAADDLDKSIIVNGSQPIIWGIGPLNQRNEVSFHSHYTKGDVFIDFGRPAKWNCPMPESEQPAPKRPKPQALQEEPTKEVEVTEAPARQPSRNRNGDRRRGQTKPQEVEEEGKPTTRRTTERRRVTSRTTSAPARTVPTPAPVAKRNAWDIPPIQCNEPDDGVFYAQMGPTGGKRGYPAITGHVGWGISWYINGLLIPEINLVRGKTYTFVVEGGFDPNVAARYHPFYITDDPVGGYEYKTAEERKAIQIFAGATTSSDGKTVPTGVGRLCHWTHQGDTEADDFESFGAYQRTLELKCDQGEPGVIQWTPDKDTPDTVYYQCFTHRYLGWKINVHDSCDFDGAGSEIEPVYAKPEDDLEDSQSIRVETRVKPNDIKHDVKVVEEQEEDLANPYDQLYLQRKPTNHTEVDQNNTTFDMDAFNLQQPKLPILDDFPLIHPPPPPKQPLKILRRPIQQRPFMKAPIRQNRPLPPHKKPIYRPPMKVHMNKRLIKAPMRPPMKPVKEMHVEISPPQASTEREPDTVNINDMKPAVNTGFHPETIVIEGGFKPIIRKEVEERVESKDGPELEYESSIGVIDVKKRNRLPENLEPVFVPSPLDGMKKHQNKMFKRRAPAKKRGRSEEQEEEQEAEEEEEEEDEIAEAAERVESYYLPPPNQRPNIELPPDTVVTFDGKRISGASLTVNIDNPYTSSEARISKAQIEPFKGKLPPLNPKFYDLNAAQLQANANLNRELDTPDPPTGPTKLYPVPVDEKARSKRAAHHTEEHTAEQEMMKMQENGTTTKTNSANFLKSSFSIVFLTLIIKSLF